MRVPRLIFLCLSCVCLLCVPLTAQAFLVEWVADDSALTALLPDERKAFVAEGRIGCDTTWELGLGQTTHHPPFPQADITWPQGGPLSLSQSYDSVLSRVTYDVGGTILTYVPDRPFSELFIRVAAKDGVDGSVSLTDLVLDGDPLDDIVSIGTSDVKILRIYDFGSEDFDFTLSGQVTMDWVGAKPTQSQLSYQIKGGNPVPLPGAVWLLGSGLVGLFGLRRRFRAG